MLVADAVMFCNACGRYSTSCAHAHAHIACKTKISTVVAIIIVHVPVQGWWFKGQNQASHCNFVNSAESIS